jgi:hypothetical protein
VVGSFRSSCLSCYHEANSPKDPDARSRACALTRASFAMGASSPSSRAIARLLFIAEHWEYTAALPRPERKLWGFRALHRRTEPCRLLVGSISKHGATHTKGRAHNAKHQPYNASIARSRISRHWRKPFFGNDLARPMTRMTRNRGPFPGAGCGGDQTRLCRHGG